MSIADNLAGPIANTATKAYVKRYDPNKPGFQLIFHKVWNDFLEAIKAFNISVPQYVKDEGVPVTKDLYRDLISIIMIVSELIIHQKII